MNLEIYLIALKFRFYNKTFVEAFFNISFSSRDISEKGKSFVPLNYFWASIKNF